MEWKSYFDRRILDRGRDYYYSGLVEDIEINDDEITALVIGNDEYEVTIELDNDDVGEMYCTCPYAEDGFYCKHMAAVLYAYEAAPKAAYSTMKRKPNAVELVASADEKTVREFLINALKKDKKLLNSFALAVSSSSGDIDISSYKQRIKYLISRHTDRHGFVDYYSSDAFIDDAIDFINTEINGLLDKGYTMAAFEISCCLFKNVSDVEMDDSGGGLSYFGGEMLDTWASIIGRADKNEKQEMFNWFMSHLNGWVIDYMEDYIEATIFDSFSEPEYLECNLKYVDERISESDDEWRKMQWVIRRMHLMEQMDLPESEFTAYCKEYYSERSVREVLVNYYLNRERTEDAIAILEDSLANFDTNIMTAGDLHCQLKELYKEIGNDEKYREHLWVLVTEHCDLDHFRELKALYSDEEWQSVRGKVFRANTSYTLMQLYNAEKLYDRLMSELENEGSPRYTRKYEAVLNKLYPERMLKLYAKYLNREARAAAKRSTYAYWAAALKHMLTIEGGDDVVAEILADWRIRYKNRPAMMQELESVGK